MHSEYMKKFSCYFQYLVKFLEFNKNVSSINMNWNECIIYHEKTEEEL